MSLIQHLPLVGDLERDNIDLVVLLCEKKGTIACNQNDWTYIAFFGCTISLLHD